jgi:hypothetical protein
MVWDLRQLQISLNFAAETCAAHECFEKLSFLEAKQNVAHEDQSQNKKIRGT